MNIIYILLGLILGGLSGTLLVSVYSYFIFVIPFIKNIDKKNLLIENHGLINYVIRGAFISFLIPILIILITLVFGNHILFEYFIYAILFVFIINLFEIYVMSRKKSKNRVILNFRKVILSKSKEPLIVDEIFKPMIL